MYGSKIRDQASAEVLYVSVCPYICLPTYLSVYLSTCIYSVCVCVVYLPVYLYICLPIYLSVYLSAHVVCVCVCVLYILWIAVFTYACGSVVIVC